MRDVTRIEIDAYLDYVRKHSALVAELGRYYGLDFHDHDSFKLDEDFNTLSTQAIRNLYLKGEFKPSKEEKRELDSVKAVHALKNPHHPEYWDKSLTTAEDVIDKKLIDATQMTCREVLIEYACDMAAKALKKNRPMAESFLKDASPDSPDRKYIFTEDQFMKIYVYLLELHEFVIRKGICYDNKPYTAGVLSEDPDD